MAFFAIPCIKLRLLSLRTLSNGVLYIGVLKICIMYRYMYVYRDFKNLCLWSSTKIVDPTNTYIYIYIYIHNTYFKSFNGKNPFGSGRRRLYVVHAICLIDNVQGLVTEIIAVKKFELPHDN